MASITELKKIVFNSELSFDEKEELMWFFDGASDAEIAAAIRLFTEDPIWIGRLSDNYRKKKLAFLTDDVKLWKVILAEEKSYLEA